MCMLLHRYTVFVVLFANAIPFYNSGSVFDHIPLSIYALQCYMYLQWTLITIYIAVELLFLYNGFFILCVVVQDESYTVINVHYSEESAIESKSVWTSQPLWTCRRLGHSFVPTGNQNVSPDEGTLYPVTIMTELFLSISADLTENV